MDEQYLKIAEPGVGVGRAKWTAFSKYCGTRYLDAFYIVPWFLPPAAQLFVRPHDVRMKKSNGKQIHQTATGSCCGSRSSMSSA